VVAEVKNGQRPHPEGKWITGFGWNHNVWGGKFPTADMLDKVAPRHPVSLQAKSGHAIWVNSAALKLWVSQTRLLIRTAGRYYEISGKATGVILEEACGWLTATSLHLPRKNLRSH
jgi:predicted amidohydrolase YtcJ